MTRNAIEKTLQKKKEEQQRLKKRFLELPRESKNSSRVFFSPKERNESILEVSKNIIVIRRV